MKSVNGPNFPALKLRKEHFRPEHSVKGKDDLREEARELRLFAKEFGQGVRQQRVRDKTKEKVGTLPLVLTRGSERGCKNDPKNWKMKML